MKYNNIEFSITDGIATITLNRPKAMNALNTETMNEIGAAVIEIENDNEIKAGIITGSGDKAFAAGADIGEFVDLDSLGIVGYIKNILDIYERMENCGKPFIAAVNGMALGGGGELALACTFRILSDTAKIGFPEVGIGVMPAAGGVQRLIRAVGRSKALKMLLTGDMIDAKEAYRIGYADEVVPGGELMERAVKLAKTISVKGPYAVKIILTSVKAGSNIDLQSANLLDNYMAGVLFSTEDKKEGINAFLEKRKPVFKGK
ncbi:MAG: enoyl-CoA hydratase-related protein [Thermodesulfobacteriota bacterium]|nr:enoyl-CoA hydratase-related protein [Thermodesulfobacteriota bacterium]